MTWFDVVVWAVRVFLLLTLVIFRPWRPKFWADPVEDPEPSPDVVGPEPLVPGRWQQPLTEAPAVNKSAAYEWDVRHADGTTHYASFAAARVAVFDEQGLWCYAGRQCECSLCWKWEHEHRRY